MLEGYYLLQMNERTGGKICAEVVQSCNESFGSCRKRQTKNWESSRKGRDGSKTAVVEGHGGSCVPASGQCTSTAPE